MQTLHLFVQTLLSPKNHPLISRQETPAEDVQITNTVSWLESDAFEHRNLHASTNYDLLSYDDEIAQTFTASFLSAPAVSPGASVDAQALSLLPSRKYARVLVKYFVENVVWIYHIIHIPTLESHLDKLYNDLEQNQQPQYGQLALLSAVFALSVYFQGAEPLSITRRWTILAQKAMIMSFMGGPQSGTYMIHPQHMRCDYPSNVNDVDIHPSGDYNQPLNVETNMTYYHFRLQLSIICREIIDAMQNLGCEMHELPYETVLSFDKKLFSIKSNFPPSFRLDANSRAQHKDLDTKYPSLAVQRTAWHFGLQTRLTRLHRPYLARGAHDPRYSYSRMVCLRSARSVIELGRELTDRGEKQNFRPVRMWTVTHHIFVATVILVMDFCLNKDDPRSEERKAEIMDAFTILESCQETSTMAKRGLQQLRDILRRGTSFPQESLTQVQIRSDELCDVSNSVNSSMQQNQDFQMPETSAMFPGLYVSDPYSRVDWENVDFDTIENINFDVDLSANDFSTLFYNGMTSQGG
ncbi:hypothetical protein SS1G_02687 [Sclerotinia sclerotiorum 1980 UF-70]|uniref:Transcription factor domain-containing protein n=1 Tax=Sclerotinia sclerotiorum (strain ATCC 18683 / 1980 / Ss-1) TaxID=665079 RepID=A7EBK1_SCLS1|nr:hypothetical protein SS1G_02687 [Sclerotinia sclerotiorum 1980 UF-70]EDN99829.1 hypothetical protein SS1G_02687 [Sclerotinia sclerotiorum 1980 UF-70]